MFGQVLYPRPNFFDRDGEPLEWVEQWGKSEPPVQDSCSTCEEDAEALRAYLADFGVSLRGESAEDASSVSSAKRSTESVAKAADGKIKDAKRETELKL